MALIHRDGRPYEAELGDEPAQPDKPAVFFDGTKFVHLEADPSQRFDAMIGSAFKGGPVSAIGMSDAGRAPMPDRWWPL